MKQTEVNTKLDAQVADMVANKPDILTVYEAEMVYAMGLIAKHLISASDAIKLFIDPKDSTRSVGLSQFNTWKQTSEKYNSMSEADRNGQPNGYNIANAVVDDHFSAMFGKRIMYSRVAILKSVELWIANPPTVRHTEESMGLRDWKNFLVDFNSYTENKVDLTLVSETKGENEQGAKGADILAAYFAKLVKVDRAEAFKTAQEYIAKFSKVKALQARADKAIKAGDFAELLEVADMLKLAKEQANTK